MPLIRFDMEPWDDAAFEHLPEWAREKVKKSTQYQKLHVPTDSVDVDVGGRQELTPDEEENPI